MSRSRRARPAPALAPRLAGLALCALAVALLACLPALPYLLPAVVAWVTINVSPYALIAVPLVLSALAACALA